MTKRTNGEGSVFYRASTNRYTATLVLPSPDGKVRRVSRTALTKKGAQAKLTELKRELLTKGDISTSTQTVETWLNTWFTTIAAEKNRPKTQAAWRSIISNHIIPSIGSVRLSKLAPVHVRKLETDIVAKGLRPTAVTAYAILSRALEYALRDGLITSKATDLEDPPAVVKATLVILTAADGLQVLRTVSGDRLGSLRAANLLTGARQGELLGLELDRVTGVLDLSWQLQRIQWEHGCGDPVSVDPKSGKSIYPCGFKNAASCPTRSIPTPPNWEYRKITNGMLLARPKSAAGTRIVPLVDPLASIIQRRLAAVSQEPNPHGLLWTADPKKDRHARVQPLDGMPVDPSWDNRNWHDSLARAGVRQARLHDARHTTASLLRKAGVPTETITRILGHSSHAMSEKYIDYDLDQLTDAMSKMSALFTLPSISPLPPE
jgi:integrase